MGSKSKMLIAGLIAISFVGLIVIAFWLPLRGELNNAQEMLQPASSEGDKADKVISEKTFTANIGTLQMVELIQGETAMESIFQLHRTTMELKDAYVAKYAGEKQQMTIWASVAPSTEEAAGQLKIMHNKMDESKVFTGHQTLVINGRQYHFVEGMGQAHYFYQRGDDVIWIAIQASQQDTMKIVSEVINML